MLPLHALILITNGVLHSPVSGTRAVSLHGRSAYAAAAAAVTAAAAAAANTDAAGLSAATSLPTLPSQVSEAFGDEGRGLSPRASTAHPSGGLADAATAAVAAAERSSEAEDLSPFDLTLAALGIEPGLLSAEDLAAALVVAVAGDGNQILLRAQSERERDEWVG